MIIIKVGHHKGGGVERHTHTETLALMPKWMSLSVSAKALLGFGLSANYIAAAAAAAYLLGHSSQKKRLCFRSLSHLGETTLAVSKI